MIRASQRAESASVRPLSRGIAQAGGVGPQVGKRAGEKLLQRGADERRLREGLGGQPHRVRVARKQPGRQRIGEVEGHVARRDVERHSPPQAEFPVKVGLSALLHGRAPAPEGERGEIGKPPDIRAGEQRLRERVEEVEDAGRKGVERRRAGHRREHRRVPHKERRVSRVQPHRYRCTPSARRLSAVRAPQNICPAARRDSRPPRAAPPVLGEQAVPRVGFRQDRLYLQNPLLPRFAEGEVGRAAHKQVGKGAHMQVSPLARHEDRPGLFRHAVVVVHPAQPEPLRPASGRNSSRGRPRGRRASSSRRRG